VFLECFSSTTGHGLPQIFKPGNLFLNILWVIFYGVAISGCGLLIYQAVDQYSQFDVITMTKIKGEPNLAMPAITFCSPDNNTYDMIIACIDRSGKDCKMNNLTLYDRYYHPLYCVQLNNGKNVTELQSNAGIAYFLTLYQPKHTDLSLAITDNNARVILNEASVNVYPGYETDLVLSKTVKTILGPPYSNCYLSTDYRQVNCIEDCDKKAMIEACGCGYDKVCQLSDQTPKICYDAYYYPSGILSKCNQECPVECNQVSFQTKRVDIELDIDNDVVHYYKSTLTEKFNISEYTDDEFKKRVTRMYIYFDKLEITEITQSPSISLTSLIANVGGLLGIEFYSFVLSRLI
jgi:amiloride-sensitive sodium channel subunit alpha